MLPAECAQRGANTDTVGDALWWAMTTITTVGHGDRHPVTSRGKFVADGSGSAAPPCSAWSPRRCPPWLVDRVREDQADAEAATNATSSSSGWR